MDAEDFYHRGSTELQAQFGTTSLAVHLAERYVLTQLDEQHVTWIAAADAVYVATVSPDGQPECSYKGGLPGFIQVPDRHTIEIPHYDGNGMFRSLGNGIATGRVGLLFLVSSAGAKLRVNGVCGLTTAEADLERHHGAKAVLRVHATAVFENCPRYLHEQPVLKHSAHCPRPGYVPPEPEWKAKPEYDGLLPD